MTDTRIALGHGDVYCPQCGTTDRLEFEWSSDLLRHWCTECGWSSRTIEFDPTIPDWKWDEESRPNAGCPWCTSCNIQWMGGDDAPAPSAWRCRRSLCGKEWMGYYTRYEDRRYRWTIRIPGRLVPHRTT